MMIVARLEAQGLHASASGDEAGADDGLPKKKALPKKKPLPGTDAEAAPLPKKKSLPPPVEAAKKKLATPASRGTKTNMGATVEVEPEPKVLQTQEDDAPSPAAAATTDAATPKAKSAPKPLTAPRPGCHIETDSCSGPREGSRTCKRNGRRFRYSFEAS